MSYCTADEVINGPLKGISLAQIASGESLTDYVEALLPATKRMVDQEAGRDFDLHTAEEVILDGNGADRIAVWKDDRTLCAPIDAVTAVSVYGTALDLTNLKVQGAAGIIGFQASPQDRLPVRRSQRGSGAVFTRDFQNVSVTLTWGYETPPADVSLAQALVTACYLVLTQGGAKSGGLLAKKIEDFEVQYGEGQFRTQIREWSQRAVLILDKYRTGYRPGSV